MARSSRSFRQKPHAFSASAKAMRNLRGGHQVVGLDPGHDRAWYTLDVTNGGEESHSEGWRVSIEFQVQDPTPL